MRVVFLGNFGVDFSSESHHAKSLEGLGCEVIRLQEGQASGEQVLEAALPAKGQRAELFVWVHTHGWQTPGRNMVEVLNELKLSDVTTATYHLDLWFGLKRQADLMNDEFYQHIGHFFTVDKQMADWLNANTPVRGHYLPPGVFGEECYMTQPSTPDRPLDVVFVGSRGYHPEWQYRPQLIDWLRATYGNRFHHFGGDGLRVVRGAALNQVYADAKVVVGDSTCINFEYPYYWSDRVPETLGRGGFLIHPYIVGMGDHFEDDVHLKYYQYGDFEQLKGLIDYFLKNKEEREAIRVQGHYHVKDKHTYKHRWAHILAELGLAVTTEQLKEATEAFGG